MGRIKDRNVGGSESEVKMAGETTNYKLKKPADNENADISVLNENADKIDIALKSVTDAAQAASKNAGNADMITKTNATVATSAWASNTTYADFPFRASVPIAGCTANHKPDVTFKLTDAMSGNYAPVCESYAGGVYIYAATKPTATLTIPTILLLKEKEVTA